MKRILLFVAVLVSGIAQVNAQTGLTFTKGFKANVTMSNFLLDKPGNKSSLGLGASFGSSEKLEIGEHFALQGELLFRYGTSGISDKINGTEHSLKYWSVEMPVYCVGQMKMGYGKAFFGIGPYVGYGFTVSCWDFGGGAILGYEFANGIFFDAAYRVGFSGLPDIDTAGATMRNQVCSLGLGYRFSWF